VSEFKIDEASKALKPFSEKQKANAAVAILLKKDKLETKILFVKRAENPKDPWSGQIGLPGGKQSPRDKDLKETVFREILEETNVNLDRCRLLGVIRTVRSQLNPEIKVVPFVFLLDREPMIRLNRNELEEYYWIPIGDLINNERTVAFGSRMHPAFVIGEVKIWGLTFRILKEFFRILSVG